MQELFGTLSDALEGAWLVAVLASFAWGVVSVLLSPCHLASIPLVVAFISNQEQPSRRRALGLSSLFAGGILVTIALVGLVTAALGRMLGNIGGTGNMIVAAIFFLVGLYLLDIIRLPWSGAGAAGFRRKGAVAAFVLGLVFGLAVGPCTFAYMAPMLGVVLKTGAARPLYAIALLAAYGIGHCIVIVFAGTFTQSVQRYLNWNQRSHGAVILKRVCGVLVLLAGLYLLYSAPQG